MSHLGEFELISRISAGSGPLPEGVLGIGDDCAVMPQRSGNDTLVTTDLLVEDRHFLLSDVSPEQLGWKSAAVNISDIAATGGRPTGAFLSIALPGSVDAGWVERFVHGFRELCDKFDVPLLGGDTSSSPDKLFINVTLLGECPHGRAVLRSGARPGDLICVTGPLGDSAAGLKIILARAAGGRTVPSAIPSAPSVILSASEESLIRRHYKPLPRVREGQLLAADAGVHAMMDISDGIASDLRHILDESSLAAEIDLHALPLSDELRQVCAERGWDAAELAVSGGEDYELLCTVAPEALERVCEALGGSFYPIGRIVAGTSAAGEPAIHWIGGEHADYHGFTHF